MADLIQIHTENNHFQYLETLRRNRTKRNRTKTFFVEGVNAINQALAHHWGIEAFAYANEYRLSDWATGILKNSQARIHFELPLELMGKISQKENASELIAIVEIPSDDLSRIPKSKNPVIVVLDRIASPGNLGTIIRSCDALGVDGVILTGHAADLYAPETIRATTGSFFSIPIIRKGSPKDLLPWFDTLKRNYPNLEVVATSANATVPLAEYDFSHPIVLMIGSENHGLSVFYRGLADSTVTIPMSGSASSLNVACATSIFLYEINRQRIT